MKTKLSKLDFALVCLMEWQVLEQQARQQSQEWNDSLCNCHKTGNYEYARVCKGKHEKYSRLFYYCRKRIAAVKDRILSELMLEKIVQNLRHGELKELRNGNMIAEFSHEQGGNYDDGLNVITFSWGAE